jgi:hypothetical protein
MDLEGKTALQYISDICKSRPFLEPASYGSPVSFAKLLESLGANSNSKYSGCGISP